MSSFSTGNKGTAPASPVKGLRFAPIRCADCALDCLRLVRWENRAVEKQKSVMAFYRNFGA